MKKPEIQIFAGHYGSGKTNLALNAAFGLSREHDEVTLCDLDIVNPYFRTKDSASLLEEAGIRLISPKYANSNLDLPVVPAEAFAVFEGGGHVVMDVGGDDAGAMALGQYFEKLRAADYQMTLVINRCRLLSRTPEEAAAFREEIERASRLRFTDIVNNTNLGRLTDKDTVINSIEYAKKTAEICALPLKYTAVREDLYPALEGKVSPLRPIRIYGKDAWDI